MDKFSSKTFAVLAFVVAGLFSALTVASALRGQGAPALLTFMFAYIMYDMGRVSLKGEE